MWFVRLALTPSPPFSPGCPQALSASNALPRPRFCCEIFPAVFGLASCGRRVGCAAQAWPLVLGRRRGAGCSSSTRVASATAWGGPDAPSAKKTTPAYCPKNDPEFHISRTECWFWGRFLIPLPGSFFAQRAGPAGVAAVCPQRRLSAGAGSRGGAAAQAPRLASAAPDRREQKVGV